MRDPRRAVRAALASASSKKRRRKKKRDRPELWLSAAVSMLLESRGVEIRGEHFVVHNENPRPAHRAIMKLAGVRPGTWDRGFCGPPSLWMELKVGGGSLSKAQRDFRAAVMAGYDDLLSSPAIARLLNERVREVLDLAARPRFVTVRRLSQVPVVLEDAGIWLKPLAPVAQREAVGLVEHHFWVEHGKMIP